jgi:hypothetical protein
VIRVDYTTRRKMERQRTLEDSYYGCHVEPPYAFNQLLPCFFVPLRWNKTINTRISRARFRND